MTSRPRRVADEAGVERALRLARYLALLLAAVAVGLLALAPLGWRAGWWSYRVSLQTLMPDAAYAGAGAVVLAVAALALGGRAGGRRGVALAVAALLVGGAVAYVPWHFRARARSLPPIDDITTDTANPPAFVALAPLREAAHGNPVAYPGARMAALQHRGYPDLAPLSLKLAPDKAFALAMATAKEMGWTIVAGDPASGRIEANQQSFWMGFTDDIVLRIAADGEGSRIDLRSASRVGRGDFGVNAARIRAYIAALRRAAGAG